MQMQRTRILAYLRAALHSVGQQHGPSVTYNIDAAISGGLDSEDLQRAKRAVIQQYWPGAKYNINAAIIELPGR